MLTSDYRFSLPNSNQRRPRQVKQSLADKYNVPIDESKRAGNSIWDIASIKSRDMMNQRAQIELEEFQEAEKKDKASYAPFMEKYHAELNKYKPILTRLNDTDFDGPAYSQSNAEPLEENEWNHAMPSPLSDEQYMPTKNYNDANTNVISSKNIPKPMGIVEPLRFLKKQFRTSVSSQTNVIYFGMMIAAVLLIISVTVVCCSK